MRRWERLVSGAVGLRDTPVGRREYGRLIHKKLREMRVSEEPWQVDGLWGCIRRGWCVGGEAFRAEMERLLTGGLCGNRRDSYSGDVARRHDELEAERLIGLGMDALGIVEDMLSGQAKGSVEKYALAWLVRRHTCVRNGWIKARLGMGTATNFSTMLSRFERAAQDEKGYVLRKRLGIIKI